MSPEAAEICEERRDTWLKAILDYVRGEKVFGIADRECTADGMTWTLRGATEPPTRLTQRKLDPRTMLDSWFAYQNYQIPGYLNRKLAVQWFNKRELKISRLRPAVLSMHFISEQAWLVLNGKVEDALVKDHAVPVKVLIDELKSLRDPTLQDVQKHLMDRYRLGVITKTEDNRFRNPEPKLIWRMPATDNSCFARYHHPQIRIVEWKGPRPSLGTNLGG